MSDEIKHECAVALVVLRKDAEHYRAKYGTGDFGGTKLSLLLEKQHNRGQDGAGAAILTANPEVLWRFPIIPKTSASGVSLADLNIWYGASPGSGLAVRIAAPAPSCPRLCCFSRSSESFVPPKSPVPYFAR